VIAVSYVTARIVLDGSAEAFFERIYVLKVIENSKLLAVV
jgi:hypothetical protein